MVNHNGLEKCYAAFQRLKEGKPELAKYKNLAPSAITLSVVSQEAGLDAGYLKPKREKHQPLITLINAFKNEIESPSLIRKRKYENMKIAKELGEEKCKSLKIQLDAALGRELLLVRQLQRLEEEIEELKKS
ncbi:TPA: hypothetical protein RUX41_002226 [Aeromonas dhakensis]|nr:hypothetical protein [Aeromonas dhakensis]